MPKIGRSSFTSSTDSQTGWFAGIIVGLALLAIGYLTFMSSARAADVSTIIAGTHVLYEGGSPGCTAQAIELEEGKTVLLTANHCISRKDAEHSIHMVTFDADKFGKRVVETIIYLDVVKADATADIAILRAVDDTIELATVPLATPSEADLALTKGVQILIAGYPGSTAAPIGDLVFTDGFYTGLAKSWVPTVKVPMLRTSGSVYYGNSGGGLYVEIDGVLKLVGVTSQTDPEMRWSNSLFVSTESIHKALRLLAPRPTTDK